jgi:hypothetical protein
VSHIVRGYIALQGLWDSAVKHVAAIVHAYPFSAHDSVLLARLLLQCSQADIEPGRAGSAQPSVSVGQLRGLCCKLRGFNSCRSSAKESLVTKCWRLCTLGRLYLTLGEEREAVKVLQVRVL